MQASMQPTAGSCRIRNLAPSLGLGFEKAQTLCNSIVPSGSRNGDMAFSMNVNVLRRTKQPLENQSARPAVLIRLIKSVGSSCFFTKVNAEVRLAAT